MPLSPLAPRDAEMLLASQSQGESQEDDAILSRGPLRGTVLFQSQDDDLADDDHAQRALQFCSQDDLPPVPMAVSHGMALFLSQQSQSQNLHQAENDNPQLLSQESELEDYCTPADQNVQLGSQPGSPSPVRKRSRPVDALAQNLTTLGVSGAEGGAAAGAPVAEPVAEPSTNPFAQPLPQQAPRRRKRAPFAQLAGGGPPSRYLRDFEELGPLGSGSFSVVSKVRHRVDGWLYAVKRVKQRYRSEADRQLKLREVFVASALAEAGCRHLCRYVGSWEEDERLFIQWELCGGGTLAARMEAPMPEPTLRAVMAQMIQALACMHARGFAHLDVKPANILVAAEGVYKLADFGMAAAPGATPLAHVNEGDSRYLSFEMMDDPQRADLFAADVFALGASLYELACGEPLPRSGQPYQWLRSNGPEPRAELSEATNNLLHWMMHADPAARPTAPQLLTVVPQLMAGLGDEAAAAADPNALLTELQAHQVRVRESDAEIRRLRQLLEEAGERLDAAEQSLACSQAC